MYESSLFTLVYLFCAEVDVIILTVCADESECYARNLKTLGVRMNTRERESVCVCAYEKKRKERESECVTAYQRGREA